MIWLGVYKKSPRLVTFEQAGKTYTGVAKEIGDKGQLLVLTDDGQENGWVLASEPYFLVDFSAARAMRENNIRLSKDDETINNQKAVKSNSVL